MTSLKAVARFALPLLLVSLAAAANPAASPGALPLAPYPRQLTLESGTLTIGPKINIGAGHSVADHFAARELAMDLAEIDGVTARVKNNDSGQVVLLRLDSSHGQRALARAGVAFPAAAHAQGYVLLVTPRRATVVAANSTGIFNGVQTLRQLFHPSAAAGASPDHATAPALEIVDWPAFPHRGVSMDISRGPIPTLHSIEQQIRILSAYKVNIYSLYFENTFYYPNLPLVSAWHGAITPAEARQIVAFAKPYHVTIVPEQESFGHLGLALQYEKFQGLDELPYGAVLSPAAAGSLPLIGQMFAELTKIFPSPYLHIGADETFELGEGRTKPLAEKIGVGQVFINYIRAINTLLRPYHRKILFWGDIAVKHPELLSQLPHDMIAVPWVYSPLPSYDRFIEPFRAAGLETWVAPGVSNWSRIYPDDNEALPNIRVMDADGLRLGSTGVLNTVWMDDGEGLINFCWYELVYGAADSWQPSINDQQFANAWDWAFYRAPGHHFAQAQSSLAQIHEILSKATHTDGEDFTTWLRPFSPAGEAYYQKAAPVASSVRLLAEQVVINLAKNRHLARRHRGLLDYPAFAARRFDYLGQKALYSQLILQLYQLAQTEAAAHPRGLYGILGRIDGVDGLVPELRNNTAQLMRAYRQLWLRENNHHGLQNILIRYQDEFQYWETLRRRLLLARGTLRTTHRLPPLAPAAPGAAPASPPTM